MNGDGEFDLHDVRLMQGLAQRVTALRPELVNNVATVGELAWVWGMSHHDDRDTWRRRLWYHRAEMVGWGWAYLPREGDSQRQDHVSCRARLPGRAAADDAYWLQLNQRDLVDLPKPLLPDGFRFRTADEVGPEAAWKAHVEAWHPSPSRCAAFRARSRHGLTGGICTSS